MKYLKNPVIYYEAFQLTADKYKRINLWPNWLKQAWYRKTDLINSVFIASIGNNTDETLTIIKNLNENNTSLFLTTIKGVENICVNDYIVKDNYGNLSVCSVSVFTWLYCHFDVLDKDINYGKQ